MRSIFNFDTTQLRHVAKAAALCGLLACGSAQAHQVWLEQDGQGAKLYFGEFGENLREASPGLLDKFVAPVAQKIGTQRAEPLTPWRGTYVLELMHNDRTAGERGSEKYDRASYVTSLTLMQKTGLAALPASPTAAPNK